MLIHQTGPSRGPRSGFGLLLLLLLVLLPLLLPTAHAGFPWPGSSSKKSDSPAETQAAHAARFEAVTGGLKERLPKGVCFREVHATALSSYAYPANNPIEDRHVLLDEQQQGVMGVGGGNPQGGEGEGEERVPGMLHAAVFDGHGTYFL